MTEKELGKITHFYDKLSVAIIKLSAPLKIGDEIAIKGQTTDLQQKIETMQFDHQDIEQGKKGQEIGIMVKDKVREGDVVYLAK